MSNNADYNSCNACFKWLTAGLFLLMQLTVCCHSQASDSGVDALLSNAKAYLKENENEKALSECEKAKALIRNNPQLVVDDKPAADSLWLVFLQESIIHQNMKNLAAAKQAMQRALKNCVKAEGEQSYDTGVLYHELGILTHRADDLKQAKVYFEKALENFQRGGLPDTHERVSITLVFLGDKYWSEKNFVTAAPLLQRAVKAHQQLCGPNSPEVVSLLRRLSDCQESLKQWRPLIDTNKSLIRIQKSKPAKERDAQVLEDAYDELSDAYREVGNILAATESLKAAIKIQEASPRKNIRELIASKTKLGVIFYQANELIDAEREFDEALKLCPQVYGRTHEIMITTTELAGSAKVQRGKWEEGTALIKKAIALAEEEYGIGHHETASVKQALGRVLFDSGEKENALHLLREAARITLASEASQGLEKACVLNNLGTAELWTGHHEKAAANLEAAHSLFLNIKNDNVVRFLIAVNETNLALNSFFDRDMEKSKHWASSSLQRAQATENKPCQILAQINLGIIEAVRGFPQEASDYLSAGLQSLVASLKPKLPELSMQDQFLTLYTAPYIAYHGAVSVCQKYSDNPTAVSLGAEAAANFKGLISDALAETSAKRKASDFSWVGFNSRKVTTKEISVALPDNTVFVDFSAFRPCNFEATSVSEMWKPTRYGAWIYSAEEAKTCRFFDLGEAAPINALIDRYRINIENSMNSLGTDSESVFESDLIQISRQLTSTLLQPILDGLGESDAVTTIILSPDSNLWLVPWSALCLADDRYLVENFSVKTVLSARSLVLESHKKASSEAVVFADPNFSLNADNLVPGKSSSAKAKYLRLPGTAKEGAAVSPQIQLLTKTKPKVFFSDKAEEEALRNVAGPRIAHFATHAFCNAILPIDDECLLVPPGNGESRRFRGKDTLIKNLKNEAVTNPWDQCGILLAGCNSQSRGQENDGVLLGSDILGLDFHGTELVVLSACETARGDIQLGEGVAGLQHAFIIAGADAVLASFWRVGDLTTVDEMSNFYRNCAGGLSYEDALAKTQRAAIKARRKRYGTAHPAAWASFGVTTAN